MASMRPATQRIRHPPVPPELSILDRLEFGAIAAFFGLVIGGLIALVVWWFCFTEFGGPRHCGAYVVWFSVGYFFLLGTIRGADCAETIALGLVAGAAAVSWEVGIAQGAQTLDGQFGWRPSMAWSAAYFVAVGLIVWLAK